MMNIPPTLLLQAMDSTPMGITLSDPHAEDSPLVYVNSGFCQLTGYGKKEVIGCNCRFLQGEETSREDVNKLSAALNNCEDSTVELLNYRKDGTPFWNRISISPLYDDTGSLVYFVGSQIDITDTRLRHDERIDHQMLLDKQQQDIRESLHFVSEDMVGHINQVHKLIAGFNGDTEQLPHDFGLYQNDLKELASTLSHNASLLCTMLETNSNDILYYVKRADARNSA